MTNCQNLSGSPSQKSQYAWLHQFSSLRCITNKKMPSHANWHQLSSIYSLIRKHFFLLVVGSMLLNQYAQAAVCTAGTSNTFTLPTLTQGFNSLQVNSPIGGVITASPAANKQFSCGTTTMIFGIYTKSPYVTTINGRRIYNTNIPGIGYAIGINGYMNTIYGNTTCPASTMWIGTADTTLLSPQPFEPNNYFGCMLSNFSGSYFATISLQLYKTATVVGSGTLNLTGQIYSSAFNGTSVDNEQAIITTPSNVVNSSCSTTNITPNPVSLPAIDGKLLPTLNSTTGQTTFNININCPASTNLYITLTDKNNIGQTGSVLTPDSNSTAKGVGMQLKYNGQTVSYGPDSPTFGNTNQFFLRSFTGSQSFPFTVSYIRTGTISPGTLSTAATFTFSYQ